MFTLDFYSHNNNQAFYFQMISQNHSKTIAFLIPILDVKTIILVSIITYF